MHFTSIVLATFLVLSSGVIADCTWPYCYRAGKTFFYACESDNDCYSINRTACTKGLESPTPSGTLCFPWNQFGMASTTYVTPSCIYPYCLNVSGYYSYGCDTNADCQAVGKVECKTGKLYEMDFLSGRCF